MAQYKILVIAHQLKHKVIAKYGDVVDETQLMGNAYELVKEGFIELVEEVQDELDVVDEIEEEIEEINDDVEEIDLVVDEVQETEKINDVQEIEVKDPKKVSSKK